MLKRFAKSIARLVGAPTPTIKPILDINAFWTNSKLSLPEQAINWFSGLMILFFNACPINLSKALCLPTSSRIATTSPLLSISALAWIPPVFENSDWLFWRNSGDLKIIL